MEEKITFFGALGRMWARIFNYKDTATRKEYWFPVIFHVLVMAAACGLMWASYYFEQGSLYYCLGAFALLGYLVFSVLPWLSLTIRRLRDAGKSGWWTLLIFIVGVGLLVLMIICTSSSAIYSSAKGGFDPAMNVAPEVYGPPEPSPDDDLNDVPIIDPDTKEPFDPKKNEEPPVYGPPEMFDPAQNEEEDVYGPPEMFEGKGSDSEEAAPSEAKEESGKDADEEAAKDSVEESAREAEEIFVVDSDNDSDDDSEEEKNVVFEEVTEETE